MNVLMSCCPFSTLRLLSKIYYQLKPVQFWMEKKDWKQFYALQFLGYSALYIQIFCTYHIHQYFLLWVLYRHDQYIIAMKRFFLYTTSTLVNFFYGLNYLKISLKEISLRTRWCSRSYHTEKTLNWEVQISLYS